MKMVCSIHHLFPPSVSMINCDIQRMRLSPSGGEILANLSALLLYLVLPDLPEPLLHSDLRILAISTHMTELSYSISDIQARIFGESIGHTFRSAEGVFPTTYGGFLQKFKSFATNPSRPVTVQTPLPPSTGPL